VVIDKSRLATYSLSPRAPFTSPSLKRSPLNVKLSELLPPEKRQWTDVADLKSASASATSFSGFRLEEAAPADSLKPANSTTIEANKAASLPVDTVSKVLNRDITVGVGGERHRRTTGVRGQPASDQDVNRVSVLRADRKGPRMAIERTIEADAFLSAIDAAAPEAVSACEGWTTHEIAAHVTGIAIEVTRHLGPYLEGEPVPKTRSFEERETPLRALGHANLLGRLDSEETRMRGLVTEVLDREPDAVIPWTGRHMAVAKFVPHLRNEQALHRWDVAGEDDISRQLLGDDDLVDHSVGELGQILLVAGRKHDPDPDTDFRVCMRSDGHRDLRVLVEAGTATLAWAGATADEPWIDIDAVARHVFIWGRRPDRHGQVRSHMSQPNLARLQALLSGY